MAEVLGSAEVDVIYRARQGQLRRELDEQVRQVEATAPSPRLNVRSGTTTALRDELDTLARSGRGGSLAFNALDEAMVGTAASGSALGGVLTGVGVALVAQLVLANRSVDAYTRLADAVREVTLRSGASAEEASRVVAVTEDYGVSSTTAANALFFLGRALSTNEEALSRIGVAVARNADGSTNLSGTLVNVADAYARTADPAQRALLIQTALGRQGRELIPILEQGGAALERLFASTPEAQILSDDDLARAREHQLAIDNLSDVWQEFTLQIGTEIVPALADVIDLLANGARAAQDVLEPIGGLIGVLSLIPGPGSVLGLGRAWRNLKDELDGTSDAANDAMQSLGDLNEEVEDAYRVALDIIEAEANQVRSRFALEDANERVRTAQERYNVALNRTGEFAERVAAAQERTADAENAVTHARRRAIQAEESRVEAAAAVEAAEFRFGRQSREANAARSALRDATWEVDEAQRSIVDSQDDLTRAQRDLADAQRAGGRGSAEAAAAQRDLQRALFDQEQTARRAAEADVKVADATAAINGETLTANERLAIYRGRLDEIATTAGPDSPLRAALAGLLSDLRAINDEIAAGDWFAGGGNWRGPATLRELQPGATTPRDLGPGAAGARDLGPGAAGARDLGGGGTVNIENLNVNNNVDAQQLPYEIAWQSGNMR